MKIIVFFLIFIQAFFIHEIKAQKSKKIFLHTVIDETFFEKVSNTKNTVRLIKKKEEKNDYYIYESELFFNDSRVEQLLPIDSSQFFVHVPELNLNNSKLFSKILINSNIKLPQEVFGENILPLYNIVRCQDRNIYILREELDVLLERVIDQILNFDSTFSNVGVSFEGYRSEGLEKYLVFKVIVDQSKTKTPILSTRDKKSKKIKTNKKTRLVNKIKIDFSTKEYFDIFKDLSFVQFNSSEKEKIKSFVNSFEKSICFEFESRSMFFQGLEVKSEHLLVNSFNIVVDSALINSITEKELVLTERWMIENGYLEPLAIVEELKYFDHLLYDEGQFKDTFSYKGLKIVKNAVYSLEETQKIENKFSDNDFKQFEFKKNKNKGGVSIEIRRKTLRKKLLNPKNEFNENLIKYVKKIEFIYSGYDNRIVTRAVIGASDVSFPAASKIKYKLFMNAPPSGYKYENAKKHGNGRSVFYTRTGKLEKIFDNKLLNILPDIYRRENLKIAFFDCTANRNTKEIIEKSTELNELFKSDKLSEFSIVFAYSNEDYEIINSWGDDFEKALNRQIKGSNEEPMYLRKRNNPNALSATFIEDVMTDIASEINDTEEFKEYMMTYDTYLTDRTYRSIPSKKKDIFKQFNLIEYEK